MSSMGTLDSGEICTYFGFEVEKLQHLFSPHKIGYIDDFWRFWLILLLRK